MAGGPVEFAPVATTLVTLVLGDQIDLINSTLGGFCGGGETSPEKKKVHLDG